MSECAICLEEGILTSLFCGHAFHSECIGRWRIHGASCPLCRWPFPRCASKRFHVRCVLDSNLLLFETLPFDDLEEEEMRQLSHVVGGGPVLCSPATGQTRNVYFHRVVLTVAEANFVLAECKVLLKNEIGPRLWSVVAERTPE